MLETIISNIDFSSIILTALTAILGWLGATIKKVYNEKVTNETIRSIISDCVNYVEQKSKNEEIKNKYEMAKDKAVNILNSKGIQVSEDEIDLLIESFVSGLKKDEVNNNGR